MKKTAITIFITLTILSFIGFVFGILELKYKDDLTKIILIEVTAIMLVVFSLVVVIINYLKKDEL